MRRAVVVHAGGGIGDLILSFPVIGAFREAYPEIELFYVTRPEMTGVASAHPGVTQALGLSPGIRETLRVAQLLRKKKVEAGCALWTTAQSAWLLKLTGARIRIGQGDRLLYSFLFTHRVRVRSTQGDTDSHWVECLLDYPAQIGLRPRNPSIELPVPDHALEEARALLLRQGAVASSPLLVVHCGKGEDVLDRGWPVDLFARAADDLARAGFQIVLTGSSREVPLVERVRAAMKLRGFSVAGKTDFLTLAGLLKLARVAVVPDSGPMHLAAAVGTPVVALFAMKKDMPKRWAPWGVPHVVARPDSFPCRRECTKETCSDFRCYRLLKPETLVTAALELSSRPTTANRL